MHWILPPLRWLLDAGCPGLPDTAKTLFGKYFTKGPRIPGWLCWDFSFPGMYSLWPWYLLSLAGWIAKGSKLQPHISTSLNILVLQCWFPVWNFAENPDFFQWFLVLQVVQLHFREFDALFWKLWLQRQRYQLFRWICVHICFTWRSGGSFDWGSLFQLSSHLHYLFGLIFSFSTSPCPFSLLKWLEITNPWRQIRGTGFWYFEKRFVSERGTRLFSKSLPTLKIVWISQEGDLGSNWQALLACLWVK